MSEFNTSIAEVSELLEAFDIKSIEKLASRQILTDDNEDASVSTSVDHFKPLYYSYVTILNQTEDEDIILEATTRIQSICTVFMNAICTKYGISVDSGWIDDHLDLFPGLVMSLYNFFVLNQESNLIELLSSYIEKKENIKVLYKNFEDFRSKKDASTTSNKKCMTTEHAVLISNIYDICAYILDSLTVDDYFTYMNQDYAPLLVIRQMYSDGMIEGDFVTRVSEIFKANTSYKSTVGFEVVSYLRRIWENV